MIKFKRDCNAVFMYADDKICGNFVGAYTDGEFRLGSVTITPQALTELKKWLALQPQSTPPAIKPKSGVKYCVHNYPLNSNCPSCERDELLTERFPVMPEVVLPQSESEVIASLDAESAPTGLNPDQTAIWNIYEAAKIKALKKNLAYGSSVFKKGVLTPELSADAAIRVRMSDKVGRLTTLLADPSKNQISDESIDDTIMDLATYAFLLLIARKRDLK